MAKLSEIGKEVIDASEAARILGVTRQAIYDFIANGDLKAERVGMRQWLIFRASVLDLKRKRNPNYKQENRSKE